MKKINVFGVLGERNRAYQGLKMLRNTALGTS